MGVVKNLLVRVGADFSELQKEMQKAQKFMKSAGKQLSETGKSLTLGVTLPIIGIGAAAVKAASDLKEVQNVVDTAFGSSAKQVDEWAKTAIKSYGLSELQAKQFAGTMRAMTGSMGLSAVEADKMSMGLSSLAGDMASFYNLDPAEAFDKLRSGISGETEPLKALGINMSVANMEAYALTKGIKKSWKEMSAAEQATLRYSYIMDATKMAQGDFAKTNTGFANSMRVLKEQLVSIGAQLGSVLLPYLEVFLGKIRSILDAFQGLSPEMQKTIVKVALVAAAIGPLLMILGSLATTTASILLWGKGVVGAMKAVQAGTKGAGAIMTAVFGPAGIVLLVIAGIALLVGGLMYLWNTNEGFKNAIITAWNAIVAFMTPILSFIKDTAIKCFNDIVTLATPYIQQLKDFTISAWNFIRDNIIPVLIIIKDAIISAFNYAWVTLQPIIESLKVFLGATWDLILAAIKFFLEVLKVAWAVAFNLLKPIVEAVFNKIKAFWDVWGGSIIGFFKATWDTVTGVFNGVVKIFTGIFQALTGLLTGNWTKCWEGIKNIFVGVWDSMKAVIKGGINFFINAINGMIRGVNKIKIPDWVPGIGGKGFSINTIPMLANGGIVTKPTLAMVGEGRESEAVLPLSKLDKLINGRNNNAPLFVIENFNNNTDSDIERIMYQAEFYRQRAALAIGGK